MQLAPLSWQRTWYTQHAPTLIDWLKPVPENTTTRSAQGILLRCMGATSLLRHMYQVLSRVDIAEGVLKECGGNKVWVVWVFCDV